MRDVSESFCLISEFELIASRNQLLEKVACRRPQRQPFNALRTPRGRNLVARDSPNLFCVALEEGEIQFHAKAVNQKVLKRFFGFALEELCFHIASRMRTVRPIPRRRKVDAESDRG